MIASTFQSGNYGDAAAALLDPPRVAELGPGQPNHAARVQLEDLTDEALFSGRPIVDRDMAAACRAGLWLYHDFLDRSHKISQDIETREGSFWHAIMHRREGDFSNSKYWLRRVGRHPVFPALAHAAHALESDAIALGAPALFAAEADWDPFRFVDLCQAASAKTAHERSVLVWVQRREWELLFDYCFGKAIGR